MMLADIHNHSLWGVDDGPKNRKTTLDMIASSYRDGVRYLCLTPHCHPGYFGDNFRKTEEAFADLKQAAAQQYPDLQLILGNELRYAPNCSGWLREGYCRTIHGSDYVLVDFSEWEKQKTIETGLERLLNAGYIPVLAHAERYRNLDRKLQKIQEFRSNSVLIQVDARALFGKFGLRAKLQTDALLRKDLVDFISTDAHDLKERPPLLSDAYNYVAKKYGQTRADAVCCENARSLFFEPVNGKDQEEIYGKW